MLKLVRKYKSVLRFILTFLGSYLLLFLVYQAYLTYGSSEVYYPDPVTHLVAQQSESLVIALGYDAQIEPSKREPAMNLAVEGQQIARIIEGCNAISIILLFMAFMFAFWDGVKRTLFFVFAGAVLIYAINVIRIALLTIAVYEYPAYSELLHGTLFPAAIYGTVFLLWMGWVRSATKKKTHA